MPVFLEPTFAVEDEILTTRKVLSEFLQKQKAYDKKYRQTMD